MSPAAHEVLDAHARERLAGLATGPVDLPAELPDRLAAEDALGLFDSQLASRHLDLAARWLRARGRGYYTIGSSGHEGNAAVAAALRADDPALLHYRSGAFYLERARRAAAAGLEVGGGPIDGVRDVALGLVAATDEPISGGRHKVFGRHELAVIPQTSTIASHLPRTVGVAFAIGRAARLGVDCPWPADAVAVCSQGDASVNHSTATGAINAAVQVGYRGLPMPLLIVCEDNGLGISVPTPEGWVAHAFADRPGLRYFAADGSDLAQTWTVARDAAAFVREQRRPAFLHLRTVRLMGHAGTDLESAYRRPAQLQADLARDPLLGTARLLVGAGVLSPAQALERYEATGERVRATLLEATDRPELATAEAVMAPLAPRRPDAVAAEVARMAERVAAGQGAAADQDTPSLTLAQTINRCLRDVLTAYGTALVFGEDVGAKGGVYGVTKGLAKKFGTARVFDTLLDEQTILGLALGAGVSGLLPIPEVQYLAYLHNAEDQLRGEAATLPFFSAGQYRNPMVVRVAGYGYQKGFGGHFHNDNAVGVLRDVPGLVIASPARPDDAAAMLRSCVAAARVDGSVSVFLEPIALYHSTDLYAGGDGAWTCPWVGPAGWAEGHVPIGRGRVHGEGSDLTIVTFGNGVPMGLRVAKRLAADGVGVRVLDLRWLAPLPVEDLVAAATATGRVLVVDETRATGGVSEGVFAALVDAGYSGRLARVAAKDSFIPLGDAANLVLVSEGEVDVAARALLAR
ncbi:transketolase C-terminal domain-containing protein [Ornithinicoccus hortensis]|uniref:2-oxoisovalerate dehydrogenase E1 component n=1 Tax=Ornithinicoccus hortensis TaxID=82346 RepID=A0A542YLT0_9MICO|nr:transketolase C-terminal domain-containing protein [Ornithinicoccus hortensis]TQL49032.1 2-oxoisovalerate dehydrogenase E1 component [Ornithinicoccus hortensis]